MALFNLNIQTSPKPFSISSPVVSLCINNSTKPPLHSRKTVYRGLSFDWHLSKPLCSCVSSLLGQNVTGTIFWTWNTVVCRRHRLRHFSCVTVSCTMRQITDFSSKYSRLVYFRQMTYFKEPNNYVERGWNTTAKCKITRHARMTRATNDVKTSTRTAKAWGCTRLECVEQLNDSTKTAKGKTNCEKGAENNR